MSGAGWPRLDVFILGAVAGQGCEPGKGVSVPTIMPNDLVGNRGAAVPGRVPASALRTLPASSRAHPPAATTGATHGARNTLTRH